VRPDAGLVLAWVALMTRRKRECRWPLATALGVVAAVFVFQRAYYGDWLPNTFYLKSGSDWPRGFWYVRQWALGDFFSLPLLVAPAVLAVMRRDLAPVCALPYVWALYVIRMGGDAFDHGRFMVPMVPVLAAMTGLVLAQLWSFTFATWARVATVAAISTLIRPPVVNSKTCPIAGTVPT
jgi:hypothetical protein